MDIYANLLVMSVRVRKIDISGEDSGVLEHYFNQITGEEAPDLEIIQPKANELIDLLARSRQYLVTFADVLLSYESMPWADDFGKFVDKLDQLANEIKDSDTLVDNWGELKTAEPINQLIGFCANIGSVRVHLGREWRDVDQGFLTRFSGLTFEPFPWSKIDIKHLWQENDNGGEMRELIYVVLSGLCATTHSIYDVVTRPDVDIAAVSRTIIKSLGGLRKQPGLDRCQHAFKKIEDSVKLLETNFTDYFRDYVETDGSKASIFIRFLGDVSEQSDKKDPLLIMQLRKIVNFYSENAAKQSKAGGAHAAKFKRFEALVQSYNTLEKKAIATMGDAAFDIDEKDDGKTVPAEQKSELEPTQPADDRDIDDLMKAINNPNKKVASVKPKGKK